MIATERFVFVHMHKTGGQTINEVISRCIAGHQIIGYHYPHSAVPEQYAQLPIVGFVRNPWDWYVSWYAFNRRPKAVNPLFSICSDGGKADFNTTVRNLVNLGNDSVRSGQYRDALISVLPDNLIGNRGVGLTKTCLRNFEDNDTAYVSWLFIRMLGLANQEKTYIGRFENLGSDFVKILNRLDVPQTEGIEHALNRTRPINSSSHSHYSHYYDEELRELINHKDSYLINRFNYSFEQEHEVSKLINIPDTNTIDGAFRKLPGKEQNYLPLSTDFDVKPILKKLELVPDEQWAQSDRDSKYKVHNQTQSLLLIHDEDMRHRNPTYHELFQQFEGALKSLLEMITGYYGNDGYFVRMLFARLMPGTSIPPHIDNSFSLLHCHRIHVPVVTNDNVLFSVGGEPRNMKTGEVCEINNATVHTVGNQGQQARIHLIIDWVPNSTTRAMDKKSRQRPPRTRAASSQMGRNEPCNCGSGLKFKHCHGALK